MARLEHVALWTENIDRLADFYAKYFGARIGPSYVNAAKGFESRFLTLEGGARLELMATTTLRPAVHEPGAQRMGLTHLALCVGGESRVDELTDQLRGAKYAILDAPRHTGDGYYESAVLDPDGNRIEIMA
jgi:lactoylglutathione lyase